jgi:prepilin-type N-terminal cleavage/methylation domain-containing protein
MFFKRKDMKKAFTLIELLIVVAIIAILAAIAIPHLLEAQTRSKVSRAKADLRTVILAIESYRVDSNHYPTYHYSDVDDPFNDFHLGGKVPAWGVPDPDWDGRNPLTTPIAYLTKMPEDPFETRRGGDPKEVREYLYVNWRYAINRITSPIWAQDQFRFSLERDGDYRLHSRGPDCYGPDPGTPYDPTNGTRSRGDIIYSPKTGYDRFVPFPFGS